MQNKKIIFYLFITFIGALLLCLQTGVVSGFDEQVFWLIRFPRALCAIAVGGGLAVAGLLIQAVYGNPLADPFTTGISSAAVFGAILGSLFPLGEIFGAQLLAFLFSMLSITALGGILKNRFQHSSEVLLAGILAGFFFSSLATLLLAITEPGTWTSALGWIFGTLGRLGLSQSLLSLLMIAVFSIFSWIHFRELDLISVDSFSAEIAGLDIAKFRKRIYILVSLITAVCVSTAGTIGFIGLLVPHFVRAFKVRSHKTLIPACFLAGATLLLFSDVVARLVLRPSELPVGVLMSLIGAPFLFLMTRKISRSMK